MGIADGGTGPTANSISNEDWLENLTGVLRTLDKLGERTRDMFILFRLENMSQGDIAALYGCSRSTVEKHVMKATFHLLLKHKGR